MAVSKVLLHAALLSLAATACGDSALHGEGRDGATERQPLGLFSTLPIYWGEGEDFAAILDSDQPKGRVRAALEEDYALQPLDALEEANLRGVTRLILAQPRPLAPSENFALDNWVRGGGQLLLFADPMLTLHSDYPLGDRRRPLDTVLLSPILKHWGLELRFEEDQAPGQRIEQVAGVDVPVDLAGHFIAAGDGASKGCTIEDGGLIARCSLGKGRVVLVADAALLDDETDATEATAALDTLVTSAFGN